MRFSVVLVLRQQTYLIFLPLLLILLIGCQQVQAFERPIKVEAADTGAPVQGANVRAEMGVRDFTEAITNADGLARLAISQNYLDRWAKVIVTAQGYQQQSVLVELLPDAPPAVVQVSRVGAQPQATPAAETTIEAPLSPTEIALSSNEPPAPVNSNAQAAAAPLANVLPAQRASYYQSKPALTIDPGKTYRAAIQTGKGDIVVLLNAQAAPEHVNNFIFLSNQGFYNGLTFHRVEPGFVIQGGDPLGTGLGGPGYTLPGEFGLVHGEGALAMARLPDEANPNRESSGSQFYITLAPTPFLDGQYSVFGQVEEGMDVVQSIEVGDKIEQIIISEE